MREFVFRELLPNALEHLVGDMRFGHERQRFGPLQRCALALRVVRRLAPRLEAVEPLFGLAVRARIRTRSSSLLSKRAWCTCRSRPSMDWMMPGLTCMRSIRAFMMFSPPYIKTILRGFS